VAVFRRRRSRDDIRRLLNDPRVEDTFHIDRDALRIQIDRPGLSPGIRALLESDHLDEISLILTLAAIGFAWCARRLFVLVASTLATSITSVVRPAFDLGQNASPSRGELAIGVAMGILFLIPLLPYGPYELEFVQNSILANQVFYNELFHGRWMYWLNNLGFGTPMPLGVPLMFHPGIRTAGRIHFTARHDDDRLARADGSHGRLFPAASRGSRYSTVRAAAVVDRLARGFSAVDLLLLPDGLD
jgi:hypothetical protein